MTEQGPAPELLHCWKRAVVFTLAFGFSILGLAAVTTYRNAPPIPECVATPTRALHFVAENIARGEENFLSDGLMDNGSVWGAWRLSRP